jgi:4-alpha-glucanotransferase
MDLLHVLNTWFWYADVSYIAEDLGTLTEEVHALRRAAGMPGMKVLQFAFDNPWNAYLPHRHEENCICYTGTHDNDTLLGWYTKADAKERDYVEQYLGVRDDVEAVRRAVLRCGQASVAHLFVAQMQDYLALGSDARINVPGVADGNWGWRMGSGAATPELAKEIRAMTHTFARC